MQRRITVRGVIVKDGKLFAQRLKSRDGSVKDYWCTPGGGLELGESLHDGLVREMIEETGVSPKIGPLLFIQQYQEAEKEFLEFFFVIENAADYQMIDLEATSHGIIEVAENEFIDPKTNNVLPEFLRTADLGARIESIQIYDYL